MGVLEPFIQWGFAGFAFILIGVIVWLVRNLLSVLERVAEVVERNTQVIGQLARDSQQTRESVERLKDALLQRPCLIKEPENDSR